MVVGRPISSNGQGLPTPRATRACSLVQWVVAAVNLLDTKLSVQASVKLTGSSFRATRRWMFACCFGVGTILRGREGFKAVDSPLGCEAVHQVPKLLLQRRSARADDADADGAFGMQALEILQIAVEERILVVPLGVATDGSHTGDCLDMIDLVRGRLARHVIDGLCDFKDVFGPAPAG